MHKRIPHINNYRDKEKTHVFNIGYEGGIFSIAERMKLKAYCYMILANIPLYVSSLSAFNAYTDKYPSTKDSYNSTIRIEPFKIPCTYFLIDPETKEIRYIGSTEDPKRRALLHLYGTQSNKELNKWIGSLKVNNLKPIFKIDKEYSDIFFARIREHELIKEYINTNIYNKTT